ncbi:hypothetical protein F5Y15DRAFT_122361 [Xylariaceae sp. FL0016]|nr:hypothetical protein F5Y15DRAFT_122361 [Xylariaceae sp. FL0016]
MSSSPDSARSSDSFPSYTSRMLNEIRRDQENFEQVLRASSPSSFETARSHISNDDCMAGHSSRRAWYYDPELGSLRLRRSPSLGVRISSPSSERHSLLSTWSPQYRINTPERAPKTWLDVFQDTWSSILICLGLKSVSGPD